jgi:hypothetical protein
VPFKLSTLRPAGSEKWHAIGAGSVVSSMSELGSKTEEVALPRYFSFAPINGHWQYRSACLKRAISRHIDMQRMGN